MIILRISTKKILKVTKNLFKSIGNIMIELVFMRLVFFIAEGTSSMIGIGGGVLYIPILLAFGFSFYQADAISIFIIMALSISAS